MFAVRLNGLGENKYATNHLGEVRVVEERETAETLAGLYSEHYGAEVIPSPLPGVGVPEVNEEETAGKFTAKKNDETGKWGVWNNTTQKWGGENMTSREQARTLARILNDQTPVKA